jgi:hypothetical protein
MRSSLPIFNTFSIHKLLKLVDKHETKVVELEVVMLHACWFMTNNRIDNDELISVLKKQTLLDNLNSSCITPSLLMTRSWMLCLLQLLTLSFLNTLQNSYNNAIQWQITFIKLEKSSYSQFKDKAKHNKINLLIVIAISLLYNKMN